MSKKDSTMSVADYFSNQVAANQKTLAGLSNDIGGVLRPNVLSMIGNGRVKLPLKHVGTIARALNIDPAFFMRMCLREYQPDMWIAVEESLGSQMVLSANERRFIEELRNARDDDPAMNEVERREFRKFVSGLHKS
jgi:hypothetical protein